MVGFLLDIGAKVLSIGISPENVRSVGMLARVRKSVCGMSVRVTRRAQRACMHNAHAQLFSEQNGSFVAPLPSA